MKEKRVTKAGEETMVKSLYPARRETFYCGLALQKHEKTLPYTASDEPEIKTQKMNPQFAFLIIKFKENEKKTKHV